MYQLYFSKEDIYGRNNIYKIEIKPLQAGFKKTFTELPDAPYKYNDCYYLCAKRKPLVNIATEMKQQWIKELEGKMELIKSIEIK